MPDPLPWLHRGDIAASMLAKAVRAGEFLSFEPDATGGLPTLPAALIRELLLEVSRPETATGRKEAPCGVRLRKARIEGELDLADCATPGRGLPTLWLEHCDIDGRINLENARLARLCLKNSRFRELDLRGADIDGPLDFSDARPFGAEGSFDPMWIDGRDSVVRGQLTGSGAILRLEPRLDQAVIDRDGARYALWLLNADVRGNLALRGGFRAEGGVSLDGAHVGGHVLCGGIRNERGGYHGAAFVSGGEDDAFNGQSARIDGNVLLRHGFEAQGPVWLMGVRIGGYLDFEMATLTGRETPAPPSETPREQDAALMLDRAEIGASLLLTGTTIRNGHVNFVGTRVRGSLEASRLHIEGVDLAGAAFVGTNAEVGDMSFDDARIPRKLDFVGTRVGGTVSFRASGLAGRGEAGPTPR